jgi:hypothetical protein
VLIKSQCEDFTRKPGFIANNEIKPLANHIGVSVPTLLKKLKRLSINGYIRKSEWGYTLTSTNTVLDNNLNLTKSKKKDGTLYHPHVSFDTNMTNDQYVVDLIMLYYLLRQIIARKNQKTNGLNVTTRKRNKIKNAPERIEIALAYLVKAGKYNSKTTVSSMLDDLQKINLIKINRGRYNEDVKWYDTNVYEVFHITKLNLENLYKRDSNADQDVINKSGEVIKRKRVNKASKPHEVKIKIALTPIEKKFIDFVWVGRSVLVANGFLSFAFLKRKISRVMIPSLLNKMITDESMKNILLAVFKSSDLNLEKRRKSLYDSNAYVYARNFDYTIDHISLNENGTGNYQSGMKVLSYDESIALAKRNRRTQSSAYGDAVTL